MNVLELQKESRFIQYRVCLFCDTHLDFGKQRDCQNRRKELPDIQRQPLAKKGAAPGDANPKDGKITIMMALL